MEDSTVSDLGHGYTPVMPAHYWDAIAPFVREAVRTAAPHTTYSEKQLYPPTARLALWAWQTASLPLDVEVIFSPPVIDRFTAQGLPQYTKAGRNTMRSRLRRMADALLGDEREPDRERPMGNSDAVRPYSPAEQAALYSWATGQPDGERYSSAMTLLALGLGAGLTGSEIARLKIADIQVDDEGVVVHVDGARSREVPVLREWEAPLVERVAGRDPGSWAFREGREGENRNLVTDFAARSRGEIDLQARRMRATWVVHHLNAGTPVVPLMLAAGLQSLESFERFVEEVRKYEPSEARRLLRVPPAAEG